MSCTSAGSVPVHNGLESRWNRAFDQLKKEKPLVHTILSGELSCKADTVPNVGANLEQKLNNAITANIQRVADRPWRIKRGTHSMVLRDMADRVMKALQK